MGGSKNGDFLSGGESSSASNNQSQFRHQKSNSATILTSHGYRHGAAGKVNHGPECDVNQRVKDLDSTFCSALIILHLFNVSAFASVWVLVAIEVATSSLSLPADFHPDDNTSSGVQRNTFHSQRLCGNSRRQFVASGQREIGNDTLRVHFQSVASYGANRTGNAYDANAVPHWEPSCVCGRNGFRWS